MVAVADGVVVSLGNGDGSFQAPRSFAAGYNPRSVAIGDFNGDAVPDLAMANFGSSDVSVLLGSGDGSFQAARTFAAGTVLAPLPWATSMAMDCWTSPWPSHPTIALSRH